MIAQEVNFDGLVGPTHNYAGLAYGNIASTHNKGKRPNPKAAALEGLEKMKFLMDLGVKQAVLPPHERPDMAALRRLGFSGNDKKALESAAREAPTLLAACCSASAMWTANAATVSPSADSHDGRVHFTPANLISQFHRSLETATTATVLQRIFPDPKFFAHHRPLPAAGLIADEGAANHMRLCGAHGQPGVEVFTFGRDGLARAEKTPQKFPARQTLQASQCVARHHGLSDVLFARQSRAAIDAGAFHNDVVATANLNVLIYHEHAWGNGGPIVSGIKKSLARCGVELTAIQIKAKQISLAAAVKSYLFNSQIVSLPNGSTALIAPLECRRVAGVRKFLDDFGVAAVHYVPVRQSMRNGGGPACLRLRVVLNDEQLQATNPGVHLTPDLYEKLKTWIHRHYRESLSPSDLADPHLLTESRRALDELSRILNLGSIYEFQRS